MSDPFKDFLEELERRRRAAAGDLPDPDAAPADAGGGADGGDGGSRPRARRPGGSPRPARNGSRLPLRALVLPLLLAAVVVGGPLITLLTDARWFDSLGAGAIYWQRLQIQGELFALGALITLLVAGMLDADTRAWVVDLVFPPLLTWHQWVWTSRTALGGVFEGEPLMVLGSDPSSPHDNGDGTMQGAR